MLVCPIGTAHHAMTVVITVTGKTAITAAFVTAIIAKSVHRIAVFAKKHYASAVAANVRTVKNWSARIVLVNAKNAKSYVVKNV